MAEQRSRNGGVVGTPTDGGVGAKKTALISNNVVGERTASVDFCGMEDLLTEEERVVRDRVRAFVDAEVLPIVAGYWERAEFPKHLVPGIAGLGIMGGSIEGHGSPGMTPLAEGLAIAELARGDIAIAGFCVVSTMAMRVIDACGSDEQKDAWLPAMARMEKVGCFALTEPQTGSDAAGMWTTARRDGDHYVLDGAKRWIGNAGEADVMALWARDEEGKVGAFVVEKGTPGVTAEVMAGKGSARSMQNFDVTFDGARIPAENRMDNGRGFRDTSSVLTHTRFNVACLSLGQAMACYEAALRYATDREQFGKPIAAFQLVQQKLVWMLTEVTAMQLLCWRLGRLLEEGRMTPEQASMAKLNNAAKARQIAASARDVLGGNGILLENHVIRQQADAEATFSFEGTDHVQTLIIGRKITGHNAFA